MAKKQSDTDETLGETMEELAKNIKMAATTKVIQDYTRIHKLTDPERDEFDPLIYGVISSLVVTLTDLLGIDTETFEKMLDRKPMVREHIEHTVIAHIELYNEMVKELPRGPR